MKNSIFKLQMHKVKKHFCSVLALLAISTVVIAGEPSFDCKKAVSALDKNICENVTLSDLDKKLSDAYFDLRTNHHERLAVSVEELIKNQREWLRDRGKDDCRDDCLITKYQQRLLQLTFPGASAEISDAKLKELENFFRGKGCESFADISASPLIKHDGLNTFACRIYEINPGMGNTLFSNCYGSNRDNFTPSCDFSLKLKSIDGFEAYTKQLRFLYLPNTDEFGTLKYGEYKDQNAAMLTALFDGTNVSGPDLHGTILLGRFAAKGIWEKEQNQKFLRLKVVAQKGLEKYYIEVKKIPAETAKKAAEFHINNLVTVFISNQYTSNDNWNVSEVNNFLKNGALPDDVAGGYFSNLQYSFSEMPKTKEQAKPEILAYLLKIAVVNDYSKSDIEKIISAGANLVNPKADDNALMNSVKRPDIMQLLIDKGANVNAQNHFGKTALMYATQYGNLDAVKILVEHHADLKQATFDSSHFASYETTLSADNRTALMYAAWHANDEVVKYLISKGADVNAKDSEGHDYKYYLTKNDYKEREGLGA